MQLTILGTGSALPSPTRLQSGYHIRRGDYDLLVDCGSGVVHRLAQAGIGHRAVDTVLLTHHHLDHVADLPTLAKARWLDDCGSFSVIGPPGTEQVCETLFGVDDLTDRIELSVRELPLATRSVTVGPHEVMTANIVHSKPGFAYRFDSGLTISGDTAPTDAIVELADGSDVLIHECAYPDGVDTDGHTTPTALGEAIAEIDVRQVYLTHLFPSAEAEANKLASTVAEYTDADVVVAEDLETVAFDVE